jgi:hypothetical protein
MDSDTLAAFRRLDRLRYTRSTHGLDAGRVVQLANTKARPKHPHYLEDSA